MMTNSNHPNQNCNIFYATACKGLKLSHLGLLGVLVVLPIYSQADPKVEEIIQSNCRGCHGVDGKAKVESWPNLNCQNRGYLYARLMNLKREGDHDIDQRLKSLSITEINKLAQHYSEQKCPRP